MRKYDGPIHLVQTPAAAKQAVEKLSSETLLGFDTETRAAFRAGEKLQPISPTARGGERSLSLSNQIHRAHSGNM